MAKTGEFTLVELLIVIVVIAILVVISVLAYSGVVDRAADSAIRADLGAIARKFEIFKIDNGRYPSAYNELPTDIKLAQAAYDESRNNAYLCVNTSKDTYAFTVAGRNKKSYALTDGTGVQGVASNNGSTTCALLGTNWGGAGTYVRQFYNATTQAWASPWS